MTLVFLDTETTGLDPDRHEVWEIAYAVDDEPILSAVVPHSFANPDPKALAMNGYLDRALDVRPSRLFEESVKADLDGATLIGANPAFDAAFLRARWGVTPWHHRLWDVEAYAAGVLGWDKLRGLAGIAEALREMGHEIPEPDHTAAADVATLRAAFRALQSIATDRSAS
jgi:DNA polymerase-3 subunit epsilon